MEKKWGVTLRSRERGDHNEDILGERNLSSIKGKM